MKKDSDMEIDRFQDPYGSKLSHNLLYFITQGITIKAEDKIVYNFF